MINNRQAGRRNRGRNNNNGRPSSNNRGGGDNGNRIDNRARGNAAQLLEKYKNMARDAQMAGDRVNTEYYLQFADHYFRVLADNRTRLDEQQQRVRPREDNGDEDGDDFDGGYEGVDDFRIDQQHAYDRTPREPDRRPERQPERQDDNRDGRDNREARDNREGRETNGNRDNREPRENREPRDGRNNSNGNNNNRRDRPRRDRFVAEGDAPVQQDRGVEGPVGNPATQAAPQQQPAPQPAPQAQAPTQTQAPTQPVVETAGESEAPRPRRGRPRKVVPVEDAHDGLDLAVLPPSIARADNDAESAEDAPKKRTRRTRPATEAAE